MFHLRFTPHDISGYTFDFIKSFEKYIVAQEDLDDDGKPLLHYHILVDTDYDIQTVRNSAKAALKIPACGKGKNNKYYALFSDWKDPAYICKYNDIKMSRGFTEKQIMEFVISGKSKYLDKQTSKIELVSRSEKKVKLPYQQAVIADAAADWYNYKKRCKEEDTLVDESEILDFIAKAMRVHGRGINEYLVKDLAYAVLYDDLDFRGLILKRLKSRFLA